MTIIKKKHNLLIVRLDTALEKNSRKYRIPRNYLSGWSDIDTRSMARHKKPQAEVQNRIPIAHYSKLYLYDQIEMLQLRTHNNIIIVTHRNAASKNNCRKREKNEPSKNIDFHVRDVSFKWFNAKVDFCTLVKYIMDLIAYREPR